MIPRSITVNGSSSSSTPVAVTTTARSAPIPLPSAHLRRTRSEVQLEELTLRAEREDALMYSRLRCGMVDRICAQRFASGGGIHPLSRKSLDGILRTKLANDRGLERQERERNPNDEDSATDDGWDVSHSPAVEKVIDGECMGSSSSSFTIPACSHGQGSRDSLFSSNRDAKLEESGQEEICMFTMDM